MSLTGKITQLIVGFHLPITGGFPNAVNSAVELNINAFQIFSKNPRGWAAKPIDSGEAAEYREKLKSAGIKKTAVHTCYLLNLASMNPELFGKSVDALAEEIIRADILAADYLNTHIGSCGGCEPEEGLDRIVSALDLAESKVKRRVTLLLENTAGPAPRLGGSFKDIGYILRKLKNRKNYGICLDTAHAFAAGYDLRNKKGLDFCLSEIGNEIGLDKLKMLHLNDSLFGLGSGRDRHADIGKGCIGKRGFSAILN
ncbi:MAG: deoxyribonuclease IV, partial [Candidatus Firestonebacteria bacterium]